MRTLEELGFRPPARNAEKLVEPQKTEIVNEHLEQRPIANLAFFERIASIAVVLKRLKPEGRCTFKLGNGRGHK